RRCLSDMMSYTSAWTCLWSRAGMLIRRTSPSTRIIGGRPADRCRSEALFLTEKASSSAISMRAFSPEFPNQPSPLRAGVQCPLGGSIALDSPLPVPAFTVPDQAPAARLQDVLARIEAAAKAAGRPCPRLLAVSKLQPAGAVADLAAAGQRAFGENYVQEGAAKRQALDPALDAGLEWHLIGHLQSNKAAVAARTFGWVHSVDRTSVIDALAARRDPAAAPLNVLLQVNVEGEEGKGGCRPGEVEALAAA